MFNTIVRASLLNGVVPTYAAFLRQQMGRNLQLEVRNSSLSSKDYSAFLSDLDLAAIGDFTEEEVSKLRSLHDQIRKVLVIIGELEIYSVDEWVRRPVLLQILEPFYTPLRLVRKLRWMLRAIDSSSALAALRAKRGLIKALDKLGLKKSDSADLRVGRQTQLEPVLTKISEDIFKKWNLTVEPPQEPFSFQIALLELKFVDEKSPVDTNLPYVRIPSEHALLLASIFPHPTYEGLNYERLSALRSHPKVREYLRAFSRYELDIMTASVRGLKNYPDWYVANRSEFETWL
jgi:hypothetical protein